MKAISLWQPWASAIAFGSKRVETRSWTTRYRGPLAIHAGKRFQNNEMGPIFEDELFWGALYPIANELSTPDNLADLKKWKASLPFGAVVAIAQLKLIHRTEDLVRNGDIFRSTLPPFRNREIRAEAAWCEHDLGNYEPGRFGWVLGDVQCLAEPIPFAGEQGLFEVPDSLLRGAKFLEPVGGWIPSKGHVPERESELTPEDVAKRVATHNFCKSLALAFRTP